VTGEILSNMQFAQRRVLAERAHYKRLLTDPYAEELSEQEIVELRRAFESFDREETR
jgi:Mn-containing catalase